MSAAPESAVSPALPPACGGAGGVAALSGPRAARLSDLSLSESFKRALSPDRSACADATAKHESPRPRPEEEGTPSSKRSGPASLPPSGWVRKKCAADSKHQVYFLNFSVKFHENVFVLK